jgi:hypothetical protein
MALGAVQQITAAGVAQTYAAPAATENILPNNGLFLHVKNANAAACVVTFTDPGRTPAGSVATNPSVSVPATTGDKMIAVPAQLVNTATGLITVAFSVQTSVLAALLRMAG